MRRAFPPWHWALAAVTGISIKWDTPNMTMNQFFLPCLSNSSSVNVFVRKISQQTWGTVRTLPYCLSVTVPFCWRNIRRRWRLTFFIVGKKYHRIWWQPHKEIYSYTLLKPIKNRDKHTWTNNFIFQTLINLLYGNMKIAATRLTAYVTYWFAR